MQTLSERTRIRTTFRNLRKQGITARMNFACCSSCGHYELSQKTDKYVFWNQQAERNSFMDGIMVHHVHLQYSDLATGRATVAALEAEGIQVEWDGTEDKAIRVLPDSIDTVIQ